MAGGQDVFKFTIAADMDVSGALGGVKQLQSAFGGLKLPANVTGDMLKDFEKLKDSLAKFKALAEKADFSKTDLKGLEKLQKEIDSTFAHLSSSFTELSSQKLYLEADYSKIKEAQAEVDKLKSDIQSKLSSIKFDINTASGGKVSLGLDQMISDMERGVKSSKVLSAAIQEVKSSIQAGDFSKAGEQLTQIENKASSLKGASAGLLDTFKQWGIIDFSGSAKSIDDMGERTRLLGEAFKKLLPFLAEDEAELKKFAVALTDVTAKKTELEKTGSANYADAMRRGADAARDLGAAEKEAATSAIQLGQATISANDQVKQLQQSTQYFFSLRNMLNLFKRGIHEAVNTVKDLDKAMTETAVVTKYSVGDMWAKLPEYTANANALGATVQDMYESTTLYYQQGLDTQQAMSIATETMKMARIAGMEAAEATDMMTAALRGFNMELNQTSAQRINDVYSNLAAKTASDTEELGTAMQRTASIAHSAGMSFEGTAAFLAQAIETTREPAENLGTAMKTIVARFQELKKNPLEMQEVDGEEVSFNKVDTALQSIGVSLKDANGQFRDLDKVFLDISERWDSLSQTQQRYIATTAAGSRQQSRFIAMMSNYDRTVELMGYANDSAGASTIQFNKTLESLEAKLNKFQNAWKRFLMGIMNDKWTKRIVDAGTGVLNIVNNIIDALSFGGKAGLLKSALSTFTAFTAMKMAGRGANALIGGLGGMLDPQSSITAGLRGGMMGNRQAANAAQAQMIYQPIVNELRAIRQLKGQELTKENQARLGAYDQYNKFKAARTELSELTAGGKAYTLSDVQAQLQGLSKANQSILMRGNAGTAYTMTKGILDRFSAGSNKNIMAGIKNGERFYNAQRKNGDIAWTEYFKAISDPKSLKAGIDRTIGNGKYNPAYEYLDNLDKHISMAASQATSNSKVMEAFRARYDELAAEGLSKQDIGAKLREENWAGQIREENQKQRSQIIEERQGGFKNSKTANALNTIGKLGTGLSQAGMGIQAFGNLLTSSANPALQVFGTALNSIGGLISGLGMGIAGIVAGFTAVAGSSVMESLAASMASVSLFGLSVTAGMLTAGLFILVAAVAGVAFAIKKHNDNIKKAAEEVTQNYKDRSSANQSNISNLKEWRSELAVLSKGVDENGLNVSLDTADYDRYLEIVDGIAKINPSIVQGYNAQGHAIIDNNRALEETLALEQRREKEILKEYTSDESLNKLIAARNLQNREYAGSGSYGDKYVETLRYELKPRTDMRKEVSKIGSELLRNKDLIDLSSLGINIDELAAGSEEEFKKVAANWDAFQELVTNSINAAGNSWSEASKEAIDKSFSAYEESATELDELTQPLYDALTAKASQTVGFKEMSNSLKAPFQQALKDLAANGEFKDGKAIGAAAKNMALKFASYNDIYLDAMDQVKEANEQFALDLSEEEYVANTKDAIDDLEELKSTLEDTPEGHAISQWIDNEIAKIRDHMSGGAKSIEEAWDTIADKVSVAESALDTFNKATEKDFDTAAEGMQQIYETAMDPEAYHSIGYGDNTFWAAAEQLLGTDNIMDKSAEEVRGMMKNIEPFLKEGPEGVQNFATKVAGLKDELEGIQGVHMSEDGWFESIDENVNPDAWKQIADYLGISEELLTAMINKSRQFRLWDFSDMAAVREAYSADDTVIHGTQKVEVTRTDDEGKETTVEADKLFITDAEFRERMGSDYYNKELRENKQAALAQQGIEILPEHLKDLDASVMKSQMGINNMTDAIETFGATGAFDKSEIYDAALNLAKEQAGENFDQDAFDQEFNDEWSSYLDNMEYPTLEPVQSIEGYVASIADFLANQEVAEGRLSKTRSDELDKAINGKEGTDTLGEYFAEGLDAAGNELTKYTYEKGLGELQSLYTSGSAYLSALEEGRNKASNEAERAAYDAEIERTTQYLESLNSQIEAGKAKWEEFNSQETPEASEEQSKEPVKDPNAGYASHDVNNGGEINTDLWSKVGQWFKDTFTLTPEEKQQAQAQKSGLNNTPSTTESKSDTTDSNNSTQITEAASGLNTASESLNTSSTSLQAAAEALSTAAMNLTNAAAVLATQGQQPGIPTTPGMPSNIPQPTQSSVSGAIVVDNSAALQSLDDVKAKAEETKSSIEAGATFKVKVNDSGLKNAAKRAESINDAAGSKNISIKATGADEAKTLTEAAKDFNKLSSKTLKLKVDVNGLSDLRSAISSVNSFYNLRDDKVTLTTVKETVNKAKGQYNHGFYAPPQAGSAAKGNYGQVGPKGRGGLTLTGELGYEIAWLPDENRSMILGANGPQMLNLPGNAVVWSHEQSKKILKQGAIPAGSASTTTATSSGNWNFGNTGGGGGGTVKAAKKAAKDVSKAAENSEKAIGNVVVWWDNIARKTEVSQRKMDSALKNFEKFTKEMRATLRKTGESLSSGGGGGDDYLKKISDYMGYNQAQLDRANRELQTLDVGGGGSQKNMKSRYGAEGSENIAQISYKKGKKSKEEFVNLAGYIKAQNGTYVVDQAALNSIGNAEKRKAVADAANKEINDRLSKKYKAEDAIEKAQEAIEKMAEELYKTFFAWENELTKIWNLTKKIEATENNISRIKTYEETLNKQITTGLAKSSDRNHMAQTMEVFRQGLAESTDKIKTQTNLIEQQKKALQDALSIEDERATLASIQAKLNQRQALDNITAQASSALSSARSNLSSAQQQAASKQSQIASLKAQKKKAKKKSKKNKIQNQINAAQNELNSINSTIGYYQTQVNNATAAYNQAVANATNYLNDTEKLAYEQYAKTLQDQIEAQTAAQKYLSVRAKADGTVEVTFDTDAFEADKLQGSFTEERAKAIQEYVKKIEETSADLSNAYKDANASVNELYDQLEQLENDWAEYANELWDIHEKEVKVQTDNFKKLSDSITKALKDLLDEVKRKLDERRKQEDNAKTERDISQKQQRLAALRADTAGGHQVEIAQLEREIADAQQNYQRTLEDQLLDKLQQQADLAAQQRERQIELQEAIVEGVNNAALVDLWMSNPEAYRDEIYEAYKLANEYDKKPEALRDQLDTKFEDLMAGLTTNQDKQEAVVDAIGDIQSTIDKIARSLLLMTTDITNAKSNGFSVSEAQSLLNASYSDLRTQGGYTAEDFAQSEVSYSQARQAFSAEELKGNSYYAQEAQNEILNVAKSNLDKAWSAYYYSNKGTVDAFEQAKIKAEELGIDTSSYNTAARTQQQKDAEEAERQRQVAAARQAKINAYNAAITAAHNAKTVTQSTLADAINKGAAIGYGVDAVARALAAGDGSGGVTWKEVAKAAKKLGYGRTTVASWSPGSSALKNATTKSQWKKYAEGGLADYTGPAWLDGTPSKPELVLDAKDTQNFLILKDILRSALKSTGSINNSYDGDATYEININVDHLNNDYDVDKVAERVKKIIVKDAGYRNVTQVRNLR